MATWSGWSPMFSRTMKSRKTEPPGTPPAPTEANMMEMTRKRSCPTPRCRSNMLAARITKTGR